jgi:hypothetical protein
MEMSEADFEYKFNAINKCYATVSQPLALSLFAKARAARKSWYNVQPGCA